MFAPFPSPYLCPVLRLLAGRWIGLVLYGDLWESGLFGLQLAISMAHQQLVHLCCHEVMVGS